MFHRDAVMTNHLGQDLARGGRIFSGGGNQALDYISMLAQSSLMALLLIFIARVSLILMINTIYHRFVRFERFVNRSFDYNSTFTTILVSAITMIALWALFKNKKEHKTTGIDVPDDDLSDIDDVPDTAQHSTENTLTTNKLIHGFSNDRYGYFFDGITVTGRIKRPLSIMQVFVKGAVEDKTITIYIHQELESVTSFAEKVADKSGIVCDGYFVFQGKKFDHDDKRNLSDLGVTKESTIEFRPRGRGGMNNDEAGPSGAGPVVPPLVQSVHDARISVINWHKLNLQPNQMASEVAINTQGLEHAVHALAAAMAETNFGDLNKTPEERAEIASGQICDSLKSVQAGELLLDAPLQRAGADSGRAAWAANMKAYRTAERAQLVAEGSTEGLPSDLAALETADIPPRHMTQPCKDLMYWQERMVKQVQLYGSEIPKIGYDWAVGTGRGTPHAARLCDRPNPARAGEAVTYGGKLRLREPSPIEICVDPLKCGDACKCTLKKRIFHGIDVHNGSCPNKHNGLVVSPETKRKMEMLKTETANLHSRIIFIKGACGSGKSLVGLMQTAYFPFEIYRNYMKSAGGIHVGDRILYIFQSNTQIEAYLNDLGVDTKKLVKQRAMVPLPDPDLANCAVCAKWGLPLNSAKALISRCFHMGFNREGHDTMGDTLWETPARQGKNCAYQDAFCYFVTHHMLKDFVYNQVHARERWQEAIMLHPLEPYEEGEPWVTGPDGHFGLIAADEGDFGTKMLPHTHGAKDDGGKRSFDHVWHEYPSAPLMFLSATQADTQKNYQVVSEVKYVEMLDLCRSRWLNMEVINQDGMQLLGVTFNMNNLTDRQLHLMRKGYVCIVPIVEHVLSKLLKLRREHKLPYVLLIDVPGDVPEIQKALKKACEAYAECPITRQPIRVCCVYSSRDDGPDTLNLQMQQGLQWAMEYDVLIMNEIGIRGYSNDSAICGLNFRNSPGDTIYEQWVGRFLRYLRWDQKTRDALARFVVWTYGCGDWEEDNAGRRELKQGCCKWHAKNNIKFGTKKVSGYKWEANQCPRCSGFVSPKVTEIIRCLKQQIFVNPDAPNNDLQLRLQQAYMHELAVNWDSGDGVADANNFIHHSNFLRGQGVDENYGRGVQQVHVLPTLNEVSAQAAAIQQQINDTERVKAYNKMKNVQLELLAQQRKIQEEREAREAARAAALACEQAEAVRLAAAAAAEAEAARVAEAEAAVVPDESTADDGHADHVYDLIFPEGEDDPMDDHPEHGEVAPPEIQAFPTALGDELLQQSEGMAVAVEPAVVPEPAVEPAVVPEPMAVVPEPVVVVPEPAVEPVAVVPEPAVEPVAGAEPALPDPQADAIAAQVEAENAQAAADQLAAADAHQNAMTAAEEAQQRQRQAEREAREAAERLVLLNRQQEAAQVAAARRALLNNDVTLQTFKAQAPTIEFCWQEGAFSFRVTTTSLMPNKQYSVYFSMATADNATQTTYSNFSEAASFDVMAALPSGPPYQTGWYSLHDRYLSSGVKRMCVVVHYDETASTQLAAMHPSTRYKPKAYVNYATRWCIIDWDVLVAPLRPAPPPEPVAPPAPVAPPLPPPPPRPPPEVIPSEMYLEDTLGKDDLFNSIWCELSQEKKHLEIVSICVMACISKASKSKSLHKNPRKIATIFRDWGVFKAPFEDVLLEYGLHARDNKVFGTLVKPFKNHTMLQYGSEDDFKAVRDVLNKYVDGWSRLQQFATLVRDRTVVQGTREAERNQSHQQDIADAQAAADATDENVSAASTVKFTPTEMFTSKRFRQEFETDQWGAKRIQLVRESDGQRVAGVHAEGNARAPRPRNSSAARAAALAAAGAAGAQPIGGHRPSADTLTATTRAELYAAFPTLEANITAYHVALCGGTFEAGDKPAADKKCDAFRRFVWLNLLASRKYPQQWPLPNGLVAMVQQRADAFKSGGTFEAFAFTHPCDASSNNLPWCHRPSAGNLSSCNNQATAAEDIHANIIINEAQGINNDEAGGV